MAFILGSRDLEVTVIEVPDPKDAPPRLIGDLLSLGPTSNITGNDHHPSKAMRFSH